MEHQKRENAEQLSRLRAATETGRMLMADNLNSPLLAPALSKLWALRMDAELTCNFTHALDRDEKDALWRETCEADHVCMRAMTMNVWQPNG